MKYLAEFLWYMVYPLTIVVSYYAVRLMIKKLDKPTAERLEE